MPSLTSASALFSVRIWTIPMWPRYAARMSGVLLGREHTHEYAHVHTQALTLSLMHSCTHTRTQHARTHARTHTQTHTHTDTHTHVTADTANTIHCMGYFATSAVAIAVRQPYHSPAFSVQNIDVGPVLYQSRGQFLVPLCNGNV